MGLVCPQQWSGFTGVNNSSGKMRFFFGGGSHQLPLIVEGLISFYIPFLSIDC